MEGRLGGRMEARMEAMIEERMEDRVEVYEAQMDQKHYHGFSPTPYNYQVQSKSFLWNKKKTQTHLGWVGGIWVVGMLVTLITACKSSAD